MHPDFKTNVLKLFALSLLHLVGVGGGGRGVGRPLGVSVEAAKTRSRLSAATPSPLSGESVPRTGSGSDSAGPPHTLTFCRDVKEASGGGG